MFLKIKGFCFSFILTSYHSGEVYIIDVSQAVEHDHPHALEFLRKDCANINGEWEAGSSHLFFKLTISDLNSVSYGNKVRLNGWF